MQLLQTARLWLTFRGWPLELHSPSVYVTGPTLCCSSVARQAVGNAAGAKDSACARVRNAWQRAGPTCRSSAHRLSALKFTTRRAEENSGRAHITRRAVACASASCHDARAVMKLLRAAEVGLARLGLAARRSSAQGRLTMAVQGTLPPMCRLPRNSLVANCATHIAPLPKADPSAIVVNEPIFIEVWTQQRQARWLLANGFA